MVKVVIKKSGQREVFDLEKIKKSIRNTLKEAGFRGEEIEKYLQKIIEEILKFVEKENEIFTPEIEAKIILELDKISKRAVELWREFRIKKQK